MFRLTKEHSLRFRQGLPIDVIILNGGRRGSGVSEFILQGFNGHDELVLALVFVPMRTGIAGRVVGPAFAGTLFERAARLWNHATTIALRGELGVDPVVELGFGDRLEFLGHSFEDSLEESARHRHRNDVFFVGAVGLDVIFVVGGQYADDGSVTVIHDRKLDALEDIIESANGSPVLVAYWYRHDLERIERRLHALHIPFARIDKPDSIERWNSGEFPVMLIHPASAGHGLNLQYGGSTLVWFSIPWSLELYTQTVDRLFRQGQKSETVSVIHIVTKGTIDERILKALSTKDRTQAALINAVKADLQI